MRATNAATVGKPGSGGAQSGHEPARHDDHGMVVVQREWNGWRTAIVHLSELEDVHWAQPHGAPRPMIHASVRDDKLVEGDSARDPGPSSTRVVVCVLKRHTTPGVFLELTRRADATAAGRQ